MTDASDNAVELDEAEVLFGEGGEVVEDDGFGGVLVCAGRVGVGAEGHDVLEFNQRVRVPFPLGVEERTRGVLAVTLAYIGVGAGDGETPVLALRQSNSVPILVEADLARRWRRIKVPG